ncbi:putative membrane protein, partial [Emiliania huxleyi virus 99B1]
MNIYSPPPQFSPPTLPPFIPIQPQTVRDFTSQATSIDLTAESTSTYQSSSYLTTPIDYYDKNSPVRPPWAVYENYGYGLPWGAATPGGYTCQQYDPVWWGVDLGTPMRVHYVRLHNRNDCCPVRLWDLDIYIGDVA